MLFQENFVSFAKKSSRGQIKVRGSAHVNDNNRGLDLYACLAAIYRSISSTIYLSPVVCKASKQEYT